MIIHADTGRQANARLMPLLVERWSPRSFDQSEIAQADLDVIFEAAGWAPSAYNVQPWTFLYARRADENWDRFLSQLVPFNRSWAKDASALVFIVSNRLSKPGSESYTHSFDTGAAWGLMAVQAAAMGYYTHGMIGVEMATVHAELGIPDDHRLEAAVAIGRRAPAENLPEVLQEREVPSGRKPVSEIAFAGNFPKA